MKKQRRKHSAVFKAKVAFEAIKGLKNQSGIAKEFENYPKMVALKRDHFYNLKPLNLNK